MNYTKIAVIGAGNVGSTVAYALLMQNITAEILLVDINKTRCKGEVYDLSDALPFSAASKIIHATPTDAGRADIIIITAGIAQKPGQSRLELLQTNKKIISQVIESISPVNKNAIIIMVTNPVDTMTLVAQECSGLPHNQVFGSGTFLDSQRIRVGVSHKINIAEQSIHAYVVGEHGDTQFPAWSCARVGNLPLNAFEQLTQETLAIIADNARKKAYDIIASKGATFYGIAACAAAICRTIIFDQKRITPLSCYQEEFGICLSMPTVLGARGIEKIVPLPLDTQENELLIASANKLQKIKKSLA